MESSATGVRMLSRFGACLVCRRRKLRCDATQPECNRCHATGNKCEYQDPACRSRTRVLQNQIEKIEGKIKEIEQRRGQSFVPSRDSSSSSHDESCLGFGTLLPQSTSQATSPIEIITPNGSVHKAPELSSYLPSDTSSGSNTVMPRGPSNMSLPGETSKKLLNMFMQRTQISGFELHIGRVLRNFQPGSSEHTVPALYYAMLLLGCHFIPEPELKFWEGMFFERTKLEIETNIARAHSSDTSKYNPLHHLQAMVMLGQWFYFKCRLLEGYVYMTRAMQFAVALGLHELDSRIYGHYVVVKPSHRRAGRWSPRDPVELGEAINLWWACLMRDFIGTVLNGLPPSISLEEIKTVWPVSLSDFEDWSGSELSNDNHSVASLFDPEHFHTVTDISQDTANSIAAKATILTCCVGKLDTERISNSEVTHEWWARFEECDRAIQSFSQSTRKAYAGRDTEDIVNIALSHTAVDCAIIQLHGPLADYELDIGAQGDPSGLLADSLGGYNYTLCIEACQSMALATAYTEGVDTSYMQMFFGISWSCTANVLAKQVPKLCRNGHMGQAKEMEQHLRMMVKNVERLVLVYPVLVALQAEHLRTLMP